MVPNRFLAAWADNSGGSTSLGAGSAAASCIGRSVQPATVFAQKAGQSLGGIAKVCACESSISTET